MSFHLAVYTGVPLLTMAITSLLAYWIYTHHSEVRGSEWYVGTLLLTVAWMTAEVFHLLVADPDLKILGTIFATKFAVLSFMGGVVFYSLYSRADFHRHPVTKVILGSVLLVTLLPTFVEPFQGFIYADIFVAAGPLEYVLVEPGPGYRLLGSLLAAVTAYALYCLVKYLLSTPRRSGLQLIFLIVGALSVMIAIALGNLGVFPLENKTHAVFGALPQAVLVSLALFRFRLFDMQPVARKTVVEDLRDPVIVADREGRIVDFNGASVAICPDVADRVGEPLADACPAVAEVVEFEAEGSRAQDRLRVRVDGRERHYSIRVSTVGDGPDLYAILLRDVTELEQSRWQLAKQNERLEQVSATISHDLRNPINVATGRAELLEELLERDELTGDALENARENVSAISRSHERMEEIIQDVLTLAREGKSVEETRTLSLAGVAHDAWEQVDTRNATLTIAADRRISADKSKLSTLLENLVRNAVEHGGAGVEVTVGPLEDGFYVEDDGPGIPADDRETVFEYGYSSAEGGTGLGLSIVRTIAESHGWIVELAEADNGGARFCFRNVEGAPVREETGEDIEPQAPEAR